MPMRCGSIVVWESLARRLPDQRASHREAEELCRMRGLNPACRPEEVARAKSYAQPI
jgi:hypothetical protein